MTHYVRGGSVQRCGLPPLQGDDLYYDEETEFKVLRAFVRLGMTLAQAKEVMEKLQSDGILFRERKNE